ncbi:hypothetical protein FB107DRAFT_251589 [Schizophyllum commune]
MAAPSPPTPAPSAPAPAPSAPAPAPSAPAPTPSTPASPSVPAASAPATSAPATSTSLRALSDAPSALSASSGGGLDATSQSGPVAGPTHLGLAPNGLVMRSGSPVGDQVGPLADDEYDAMKVGWPGVRKRTPADLEEGQEVDGQEKRPRVERRYILVRLEPLRAPYHDELSPAEQSVDYRVYRGEDDVAQEKEALYRIVTHQPRKRIVVEGDEGYGATFPLLQDILATKVLSPDVFATAPRPEDPAQRFRVIALTEDAAHLVMSPNATFVPYVPSPNDAHYHLRMRVDGNFGAEDLTLVPTYWMEGKAPHIACIPRCPPAPGHPWHLMFLGVDSWFEKVEGLYTTNDDKVVLTAVAFRELKKLVYPLRRLTAEYLLNCKRKKIEANPWACGLEITLQHLLMRMSYMPVSFRRAVLMGRQCQRLWRELFGMMNFVNFIQPVLTGVVDPPDLATPHWFIGTITDNFEQAQLLFRAGVPVWFVQNFEEVTRRARLQLTIPHAALAVQMRSPAEMMCIDRHPDNLPHIFEGVPTDWKRLHYLHRYSTMRVALSRPSDDNNHDPLWYDGSKANRDVRFGASTEQDIKQMPEYLSEVGTSAPLRAHAEEVVTLPPVDFLPSGLDDLEDSSEILPGEFYGTSAPQPLSAALPAPATPSTSTSSRASTSTAASSSRASRTSVPSSSSATTSGRAGHASTRRPSEEKPLVRVVWQQERDRVKPNWRSDAQKTDDYRCFPSPDLITGAASLEKVADFVHAWVLLRPRLLDNARYNPRDAQAFAHRGAGMWDSHAHFQEGHGHHNDLRERRNGLACGLNTADWRQLLFTRVTSRSQSRYIVHQMTTIRDLLGDDFNWNAFIKNLSEPYVLRGHVVQPGNLPPPHVMRAEMWYLQELLFRQDLLELDRRLRVILISKLEELERFRYVFDKRTWCGADILNLCEVEKGRGLMAESWRERVRYVQAFARLMLDWEVTLPRCLRWEVDADRMTEAHFVWFERQVISFYCGVLWLTLKRKAVAPPVRRDSV